MSDLHQRLHAERTGKNTLSVDCWACEAAASEVIAALQERLNRAEARLRRHDALADWLLSPDEQRALWRDFFREQLRRRYPAPVADPRGDTP